MIKGINIPVTISPTRVFEPISLPECEELSECETGCSTVATYKKVPPCKCASQDQIDEL